MQYQPWFKAFADLSERKAHYSDAQFRAFVEMLCAAAASRTPGIFVSLAAVRRIVGGSVDFLVEQGDLIIEDGGAVTVHGWARCQRPFDEGHAERQRRYRDRKNDADDDASSRSSLQRHNGSSTTTLREDTYSEGVSFPAPVPAPAHVTPARDVVGYPDGDHDSLDTYHELAGYRPWGQWSGDQLKAAMVEYGDATVDAALRFEAGRHTDRKTLMKRTLTKLARDADRAEMAREKAPKVVKSAQDKAAEEASFQAIRRQMYAEDMASIAKQRAENAE